MVMKILRHKKRTELFVVLLFALIWNASAYYFPRLITPGWEHYDMTTEIDQQIPFSPWTVAIYFGCYLFWAVNYCICALGSDRERYRYFSADCIAKAVCMILFFIIPTTNVRPEVAGNDIWAWLMRLLYAIDPADNLFPSIHCLVSWLCWVGVRKRKDVHVVYRYFSLVAALAVCVSTITTRQHVMADVVSGIVIAELCYWVAALPKVQSVYCTFIEKIVRLADRLLKTDKKSKTK